MCWANGHTWLLKQTYIWSLILSRLLVCNRFFCGSGSRRNFVNLAVRGANGGCFVWLAADLWKFSTGSDLQEKEWSHFRFTGSGAVPALAAHRVLIRIPSGRAGRKSWFGRCNLEVTYIDKYCWKDDSTRLQTLTAQLREMQAAQRHTRHSSLAKWETQLNMEIPDNIWDLTWLPVRSAWENAFQLSGN